ncbi:Ribosomal protein S6 kinase alpha-5 [Eumeta japonica]|uniref:Ribosomal protein S6 kinase alpha-5 n=1 Tax=Eumeta variegata TaxID=151549 RepID=A0A4C1ZSD6_EUMVA|nr:Ribosomal protein S6 kinase alpha-5 [Eumeta japonica]
MCKEGNWITTWAPFFFSQTGTRQTGQQLRAHREAGASASVLCMFSDGGFCDRVQPARRPLLAPLSLCKFMPYGKVFLVRKRCGVDEGKLYAMKVVKKASIVQKLKTAEHTRTERQVLEAVRECPFLVTLHYAFQTDAKLHLILGE